MKPIDQMTLSECLDELHAVSRYNRPIIDRIHDLTRWIPVSEKKPTIEDGQQVLVKSREIANWYHVVSFMTVSKLNGDECWQRITPPEGAC
jgi:hypothetical protein